jgi:hypothetical protein
MDSIGDLKASGDPIRRLQGGWGNPSTAKKHRGRREPLERSYSLDALDVHFRDICQGGILTLH